MTYRIGVDEAGKGPVLGPMVAAAVRVGPGETPVDEVDVSSILPADVADSKRLPATTRESLAAQLRESPAVDVGIGVVTTAEIDDPETDMNGLTVAAQVRALAAVAVDGDHAIVDAGDVSEARFARRVAAGVAAADNGVAVDTDAPDVAVDTGDSGVAVDVAAEHGADERHRLVGAASILAKVERDARIAAIDADYEADIGSGYPSDRTTRAFLADYVERHGDLPDCARRSWATCEDVLAAAEQSELAEF